MVTNGNVLGSECEMPAKSETVPPTSTKSRVSGKDPVFNAFYTECYSQGMEDATVSATRVAPPSSKTWRQSRRTVAFAATPRRVTRGPRASTGSPPRRSIKSGLYYTWDRIARHNLVARAFCATQSDVENRSHARFSKAEPNVGKVGIS